MTYNPMKSVLKYGSDWVYEVSDLYPQLFFGGAEKMFVSFAKNLDHPDLRKTLRSSAGSSNGEKFRQLMELCE